MNTFLILQINKFPEVGQDWLIHTSLMTWDRLDINGEVNLVQFQTIVSTVFLQNFVLAFELFDSKFQGSNTGMTLC